MRTPIRVLPQLCASCEHHHTGEMASMATYPACPVCGCTAFRIHPDELAAADANDALEEAYYPHGRILGGDTARGLAAAITALEEVMQRQGWDIPARMGCLQIHVAPAPAGVPDGPGPGHRPAGLAGFLTAPINLTYANLWQNTNGNPNLFVTMLAQMAELRPDLFDAYRQYSDIDPADPAIGWWAVFEGFVRRTGDPLVESAHDRPELAVDEVRTLYAVDVDERVYEVTRLRSTAEVTVSAEPWPLFAARVLGDEPEDQMPPLLTSLRALARYSRIETQARGVIARALASDQDSDEGSA